ncbi:MAG: PIN domain-containing protein [Spirochaetota bacterium]
MQAKGATLRLFLDANILFSASCSDGAIRRLLSELKRLGHVLVVDGYVWEEALRNVALQQPSSVEALHQLSAELELHTGSASAGVTPGPDWGLPAKDVAVLAAAITLHCDILITGDFRNFGQLYGTKVAGVSILRPSQAAEALI